MNVRPLHDYVIVLRKEEEHLSAGGIVIPDTVTEKPVQGRLWRLGTAGSSREGMLYRWVRNPVTWFCSISMQVRRSSLMVRNYS